MCAKIEVNYFFLNESARGVNVSLLYVLLNMYAHNRIILIQLKRARNIFCIYT